jgi:hypothetical protein
VTLLRAVGWLSRDDLTYRTGHAGPALATPGAQEKGHHRLHYSLLFHGADSPASRWRMAESALLPLQPLTAGGTAPHLMSPAQADAALDSGVEIETSEVQMTACIPAPGGYDVRLLNVSNDQSEAVVRVAGVSGDVLCVSLGGTVIKRLACSGGTVRFRMRPWEITTLQVRWDAAAGSH